MTAWWWPTKLWRHGDDHGLDQETGSIEALYLRRLYRLVLLDARKELTADQRRLVNYALDATYRDCLSVGVQTQARALLGLPPVG